MKRKKKSLVEDSGPTDLDRGRTMGKSDLTVSRPNESILSLHIFFVL